MDLQFEKPTFEKTQSTESFGTTRTKFLNTSILKEDKKAVRASLKKDKNLKKMKNKMKQKSNGSFTPLEDEEKEKKRLQEIKECFEKSQTQKEAYSNLKTLLLRHMRVLDDLTKLRNHYYDVYLSALTEKVEEQRRIIKKRAEKMERKLKEKEKNQINKRKYERSTLSGDDAFIKELFKSHWYNVLILEDQLKKDGKLRTIEDYDKFWEDVLSQRINDGDSVVNTSSHTKSKGHGSWTSSLASESIIDNQPVLPRELSLIREDTELSKKSHSVGKKQLKKLKSSASFLSAPVKGRRQDVHPKALELDQRCPMTEMPHLQMLDMDLEPPKEDPEVVQMREEFGARARIRNHKRKTLMNMHEIALTHQAATSRIFLHHPKFMARLEGAELVDVASSVKSINLPVDSTSSLPTSLPAINCFTNLQNQHESTPLYNEIIEEQTESEDHAERVTSSSRGSSYRNSTSSQSSNHNEDTDCCGNGAYSGKFDQKQPSSPLPLTLDSIYQKCEIKEAKCLSTLWKNYGKDLPAIT